MKFAPNVIKDSLCELFGWFEAGRLRPFVKDVFPLEEANLALGTLKSRKAIGKVVVRIPRDI